MGIFQDALNLIVEFAILVFAYIGVAVILMAGVKGVVNYVTRDPKTRLDLAKGLAMGLEFKLGSEILRTVVVKGNDRAGICRRDYSSARCTRRC